MKTDKKPFEPDSLFSNLRQQEGTSFLGLNKTNTPIDDDVTRRRSRILSGNQPFFTLKTDLNHSKAYKDFNNFDNIDNLAEIDSTMYNQTPFTQNCAPMLTPKNRHCQAE